MLYLPKISFLSLILLPGCFAQNPIYVDSRFKPGEKIAINSGAIEWNRGSLGEGSVDLVWDTYMTDDEINHYNNRRSLIRATKGLPQLNDIGNLDNFAGKDYKIDFIGPLQERIVIVVDDYEGYDGDYWRVYDIVIHELGHHFNIHEHSLDPNAAMYGEVKTSNFWHCVTKDDMRAFCNADGHPCRYQGMPYCKEPRTTITSNVVF